MYCNTQAVFLFLTAHRSVILIRFRTIPCDSHSCDENIWKNYHFVTDGGILFYLCTQLTRPVRPTFSQGHVNRQVYKHFELKTLYTG